jgi:hypothetical protein
MRFKIKKIKKECIISNIVLAQDGRGWDKDTDRGGRRMENEFTIPPRIGSVKDVVLI